MSKENLTRDDSLTRGADKVGVIGAIIAAMGCAACFPALASLGAAIGLGFLSQFEGVFIRYLLPLFALIALLANLVSGMRHKQWLRTALGLIGPLLVMAAALFMVLYGWPTAWLLYPGLVLMVAVSIWDLVAPPYKVCDAPNTSSAST
ncbi:MAG: organomercurial transporter MerC [Gemmatimonadota bacterium]